MASINTVATDIALPILATLVVLTVAVGTAGGGDGSIWSGIMGEGDELERQLNAFNSEVTLSPQNPNLAKDQLRATTYLTTLRSINCRLVAAAMADEKYNDYDTIKEQDGSIEFEDGITLLEENDNNVLKLSEGVDSNADILAPATTLDDEDVATMACEGGESFMQLTGLDEVRDFVDSPMKYAGEEMVVDPTMEFFGLDNKKTLDGKIEEDDFNNQPGRYGAVAFTYPSEDRDGNENNAPIIMPADEYPMRPDITIPGIEGVPSTGYPYPFGIADVQGSFGLNTYYKPGSRFWQKDDSDLVVLNYMAFAPDPYIANWMRKDLDGEEIEDYVNLPGPGSSQATATFSYSINDDYSNFREYPVLPFRPAMENVPMITNSRLKEELENGLTMPLSPEVAIFEQRALENQASVPQNDFPEEFLTGPRRTYTYLDEDLMYSADNGPSFRALLHRDYEFVICPGSTGVIQSNVNTPYHDGATTEGMERNDVAYPFVRLDTGSPRNCVEDYILGGGWERAEDKVVEKDAVNKEYEFRGIDGAVEKSTEVQNTVKEGLGLQMDVSLEGSRPMVDINVKEVVREESEDGDVDMETKLIFQDITDSEGEEKQEKEEESVKVIEEDILVHEGKTYSGSLDIRSLEAIDGRLSPGDKIKFRVQTEEFTGDDEKSFSVEFEMKEEYFSEVDGTGEDITGADLFDRNDVSCNSYRDVRDPAEVVTTNGNTYSLKCGVAPYGDAGAPDHLYRFQKYAREGEFATCKPAIHDYEGSPVHLYYGHDSEVEGDNALHTETIETVIVDLKCKYTESSIDMAYDTFGEGGDKNAERFTCGENGAEDFGNDRFLRDEADEFCDSKDYQGPAALYFVTSLEKFPQGAGDSVEEYVYAGSYFKDFQFQTLREAEKRYGEEFSPASEPGKECHVSLESGGPAGLCLNFNDIGIEVNDYSDNRLDNWKVGNAGADKDGVSSQGENISDDGFFPGGFYGYCPSGDWRYSSGSWGCTG